MSMITARQIVAGLLEDFSGQDWEQRPGGAKDAWRQGGFKKFSLKANKFTGKRPGEARPSDKAYQSGKSKKTGEDETPLARALKSSQAHRFAWKPPTT